MADSKIINFSKIMKNKHVIAIALPLATLAIIVSATAVSAHGWFGGFAGSQLSPDQIAEREQQMFAREAQVLGTSVDEIKQAWAEGKTMREIIAEKGLNESDIQWRAQELRKAEQKTRLQALVDKGVITQAQADKRLQSMQEKKQSGKGHMDGSGVGGRMMGGGFFR